MGEKILLVCTETMPEDARANLEKLLADEGHEVEIQRSAPRIVISTTAGLGLSPMTRLLGEQLKEHMVTGIKHQREEFVPRSERRAKYRQERGMGKRK